MRITTAHYGVVLETLDRDLRRFWEIEEVPQKVPRSSTSAKSTSELHILVHRTDAISFDYRPFKNGLSISISESRSIAISSFRRLEQRLIRVPINAFENREFFAEYEILNHMIKSPSKLSTEIVKANLLFPYHAVLRDSSAITFLRVVFNASCRTSNGTSLSDSLTTLNFRGI